MTLPKLPIKQPLGNTLVLLLASALLSGCASKRSLSEPIVDLRGTDQLTYTRDLTECREFAKQVPVGTKAGSGAAAGAVLGGLIGAAVGDSGTAARVAGAGAVNGGARGGYSGYQERARIVKSCLRQRGYAVLN